MKVVLDTEVTISPPEGWVEGNSLLKGNPSPYLPTNRLVSVQYKESGGSGGVFYHTDPTFKQDVQGILNKTTLLIGFNIKFDLSWLLECGFSYDGEIYDVMLVEYLLNGGQKVGLSLNDVAESYGEPLKLDKVKELWQKGINTDQIDRAILTEYGYYDVELTDKLYIRQKEVI